jgi:succinyl-diaminopimelate desuccinylase
VLAKVENLSKFADKYQLAIETAIKENPLGGLSGFEVEWNLLDFRMRPLTTVGSGPAEKSFVDYLRTCCLPSWLLDRSQMEVFHWMIEWATRPYYQIRGAVFEARFMEAVLINAMHSVGRQFEQRLFTWRGNLLFSTPVGADTIPQEWHIAKRRYLERCVELYGEKLATAGMHTNLSLPEPLLAWDFMHLNPSARADRQLVDYQNEVYITGTRLMRAFASLFIATTASTPLCPGFQDGEPVVKLTEVDSHRSLTFPNPPQLDLPDLYRSYQDYLRISHDLVRRGVRFGNNNWTPVRARSFAEPVERLIDITSEQLERLYGKGLYSVDRIPSVEEMADQTEVENLLARINLPMSRVEVRTDDGGHPLEIDIAHLTLKQLLLIAFYYDPVFARGFRYDREDIARARRNELNAARDGLKAEIENPLTGKPVGLREFLRWTLDELRPLAEALGLWEDLGPLVEMAAGGPNAAERLREQLAAELGDRDVVPLDVLRALAEAREEQVNTDLQVIAGSLGLLDGEANKLGDYLQKARDEVRSEPQAPIQFRPRSDHFVEINYPDKTAEILDLASTLVRIPSVSVGESIRLFDVHRAGTLIHDYLRLRGLEVHYFNQSDYPALWAGFPGALDSPVMFCGHFDVVAPEPDDGQFEPRIDGDYLWGRGSADMKTVVSTYLVWMKDRVKKGPPFPPFNLLLVGNEENGETDPMGTPYVLQHLAEKYHYTPALMIAGERTGEVGDEFFGKVCIQNRGVVRFQILGYGARAHSAMAEATRDLSERLVEARLAIRSMMESHLTLESSDGWRSLVRFPFIQIGTPGIYNITPDVGRLGVEVRPIPQDDTSRLFSEIQAYCMENGLEIRDVVLENGIVCNPDNPYLLQLLQAVRQRSGSEPQLGRKLAGTSARFAPDGQGVVWGQTGVGPHSRDERHFIPSILPYYRTLSEFDRLLTPKEGIHVP